MDTMARHLDANDTLRFEHEYDEGVDHEFAYDDDDDDDDYEPWIEISSSSSSSEDDNGEDDLSYDVSIRDELSWLPSEKLENLPKVITTRYQIAQWELKNGKDVFDDYSSPMKASVATRKRMRRNLWLAVKLCCLFCAIVIASLTMLPSSIALDFVLGENEETIYVPGVGFSGFWFSLGRLKSIPDPTSKHYVCFSAGCLGSVAILNGFSVDEMACMAQSAQLSWKDGHINRYEVVSNFVDGLVYRKFPIGPSGDTLDCLGRLDLLGDDKNGDDNLDNASIIENATTTKLDNNADLLSRLHILTTNTSMKASMRSPRSLLELREMLIQTTWM